MSHPIFHFIVLCRPSPSGHAAPFRLHNYLTIKSCAEHHPDCEIWVHTDGNIQGEWWDRAKEHVTVKPREFRYGTNDGKRFRFLAYVADQARLEILHEFGGIYADIDTIFLDNIEDMAEFDGIHIQLEAPGMPVASVMYAPKGHPILEEWLTHEKVLIEGKWGDYARKVVQELARKHPNSFRMTRLDETGPLWDDRIANPFFLSDQVELKNSRVVNLCQHATYEDYLSMFSETAIHEFNSTYSQLVRPYLGRFKFDFTAVMPVSIEHQDRLENVLIVTKYILDQMCVDHVIVVEHGPKPQLMHILDDRIRYIYVQEKGEEMWNKAKVLNSALPWIETTSMAIWDADVMISLRQLQAGVDAMVRAGNKAVIPYENMYHVHRKYLNDCQTGRLMPAKIVSSERNYIFKTSTGTAAGLFMMRTDAFKHLRGLNEQYWGWGLEDDDMLIRMMNLVEGSIIKCIGPLIHFTHFRTKRSFPDKEHCERSRVLRARVAMWPKERVLAYFGLAPEVGGYCQKRYPDEEQPGERKMIDKLEVEAIQGTPRALTAGTNPLKRH